MVRVLAAGTAVVLFGLGLIFLGLGDLDRVAAGATVAGLLALSVAVLAHVADPGRR